MRSLLAPLALFASAVSGYAQFTDATLPPLSSSDGAFITQDSAQTNWPSSALQNYSTSNSFVAPAAGGTDAWGHTWTTTAPDFSGVNNGGTLRKIFLGPGNSSFTPAVGYTYLTSPSSAGNSFTLDYLNEVYSPSSFAFGDYTDVNLLPGQVSTFDFWIDTNSGVYTLLNPANSQTTSAATAQVLWTQSPLLVSTYVTSANGFEDVPTWIGTLVETTTGGASQEFTFAIQEFEASGTVLNNTPVPEPSTYGLLGVLALAGLVLKRKFRS